MIFDVLVIGHVRSNAWRALVSIAAIALGIAIAFALALTNALSVRSLDSDRELFSQRVDLQVLPFGNRLPQDVLARVRYLEGVTSAAAIIDRPIALGVDGSGRGGDAARLIGVDLLQPLPGVAGFDEARPGPFAPAGLFIDPGELIGTNGAIVSSATAARLRLRRGAPFFALSGERVIRLRVASVMPTSATGVDSSVVFVDVSTAQAMLHELGTVDRIDIVANASARTLQPAIVAALGGRARVVVPVPSGFSLGALSRGIEATFGVLTSIGLAVGGLLVFNAVGTSIAHRRGDIGTLRALGVARRSIVMAFVGEGAAYGALGGFLGAALAEFAVRTEASLAGSERLAAYDVWLVAFAVLLGIGVAVVSSIAPALSAAHIAPAFAARQGGFEGSRPARGRFVASALAGSGAFALGIALAFHPSRATAFVLGFPLCFATGTVLVIAPLWNAFGKAVRGATSGAPPSLRFAGVTLAAIPKRVAVAVAALCIAVFAGVAFDVASDSFATALHAWAERGIAGDMLVRPFGDGGTFDAGVVARVRATPGVREVTAIRTIGTQTGSTEVAVRGEDAPVPHVMMTEPPAEVGAPLAAALRIKTGDVVALRTARRDLRVRISAVRPDFSDARGAIVVERRVLREAFGDARIDALRVSIDPHGNPTTIENAIAGGLAPRRIVTVATRELRKRFTGVFDGTFAFIGTLAVVVVTIASLGVASVLSALVFERRFELRMLRTLGTPRATIVRMLASEALLVAFCGSALGLAVGLAFAAVQLYVVDPVAIGFAIPLTVPFASICVLLAGAVLACVIGPVVAAPAAFRIATDRAP